MGKSKILFYEENKDRFQKFHEKIIHIVVNDLIPSPNTLKNEQWLNENRQRKSIHKAVESLFLQNDDLIIISDLDEIPDPQTLKMLKENYSSISIVSLEMDFYYYNIECKSTDKWYKAKVCTYFFYQTQMNNDPQLIRETECDKVEKGGWHLSYFGDSEFIRNKLANFSHCEYNTQEVLKNIDKRVLSRTDLFDRPETKFIFIPKDTNNYLPPFF